MPDPITLEALIARLQKEDPSRELDAALAELSRWTAPNFTGSIDAKLPGEDAGYWIIRGPHEGRWYACYHPPGTGAGWDGEAITEAMARRAAYLKSELAEMEGGGDG